jgi:hypothetical protein
MHIVFLAEPNTCNNAKTLSIAINKYTKHTSEMVQTCGKNSFSDSYLKNEDGGVFAQDMMSEELRQIISRGDFFVICDTQWDYYPGQKKLYPLMVKTKDNQQLDIKGLLPRSFLYMNGTVFRNRHDWYLNESRKYGMKVACSTLDLLFDPKLCFWLPSPVQMSNVKYEFKPYEGEEIVVSHCPTDRKVKHTEEFLDAACDLGLKVMVIEKTSHDDCMNLRRKAQIHFDHFGNGAYCLASIEASAIGQIDITDMSKCHDIFPDHPFVEVHNGDVKTALKEAIKIYESDNRMEYLMSARDWVFKLHDSSNVIPILMREISSSMGWKE